MKLKTKVLLVVVAVHAVFIYLLIKLYTADRTTFFIGEAVLFVSFLLSYWLYQSISRTFDTISQELKP
ncbi:hypothetical protein [Pedobacter steynii]